MESQGSPAPSAAVERGFQEALDKFKTRLTREERESFRFATLDDLTRTARKIQAEQAERSAAMHLPRIRAFLEALKQFGEVVEVFLNSSEIVAFVWGPMKFLLQVSVASGHRH
jgi:beta-phosphoglucomutase-like phosphatase (HAD superfamily)